MISSFSTSFLYAEIDGAFKISKRLSINISFRDFGGFLLYAIDSDGNRLLIQSEKNDSTKQISLNFNGHIFNKNKIYYSNSINNFEVVLKFENNKLIIDQDLIYDVFKSRILVPDPFQGYPIPKGYHSRNEKMYFWLGNIGPYEGLKNEVYKPFKNPIFGCLHYLYINFNQLYFEKDGEYFSKSCEKIFNQTNCIRNNCTEISVKENVLDCSFISINTNEKCYHDLIEYDGQEKSFEKLHNFTESISLKLIWKQKLVRRFCLVEIILSDNSLLLFYINKASQLEMCLKSHLSQDCITNSLFNTTLDSTHVLIVTVENPRIFIKISDGKIIRNIVQSIPDYIAKISIGFGRQENLCVKFEGKFAFRYDVSQFKTICPQKVMFSLFKVSILLFVGTALLVIANIIYHLVSLKLKHPKLNDKLEIYNLNNYEQIEIRDVKLPEVPQHHEIEQSVYDYEL